MMGTMTGRGTVLSSEEIEQIRKTALRAIRPLKPSKDSQRYVSAWERTKAGRALPPYYLVYFLLVELLGFQHSGREEKIDWIIPVDFEGNFASIEHRKFGLGIFSSATPEDEVVAERIVKVIDKGVKAAVPFFNHLAAKAVEHSHLNVNNISGWLFSRYEYLRDQFREKVASAEARKDEVEKMVHQAKPPAVVSVSYSYPAFRLKQEAAWIGVAAIEAFFSWTEHVFILIAVLSGKLTKGDEIAHLAGEDWSEKVKKALDLNDKKTKHLFDELLGIRRQIRNYIAHGAFGKQGEAFQFHSSAGAVPVTLTDSDGRDRFSILGNPSFDEAAAIAMAETFIEHLWSGALAPAKMYLQDAGLPVILTFASDGTYKTAMASSKDMENFVDHLTHEIDNAANMDW